MTVLTASTRRASERATLELPFRIPAKDMFSPREAARVIGDDVSVDFVEKLIDRGQLGSHQHNAGTGERKMKRIPRVWLVAYMIRTADYDDASLGDALLACLPNLPAATLARIAAVAARLAGGGK